jgi:hypothetical protein
VEERIDDGHLLGSGPYDGCRSRPAAETEINMEQHMSLNKDAEPTTLVLGVKVYVALVDHLCTNRRMLESSIGIERRAGQAYCAAALSCIGG